MTFPGSGAACERTSSGGQREGSGTPCSDQGQWIGVSARIQAIADSGDTIASRLAAEIVELLGGTPSTGPPSSSSRPIRAMVPQVMRPASVT